MTSLGFSSRCARTEAIFPSHYGYGVASPV